jgi:hypothetical protein
MDDGEQSNALSGDEFEVGEYEHSVVGVGDDMHDGNSAVGGGQAVVK